MTFMFKTSQKTDIDDNALYIHVALIHINSNFKQTE